MKCLVCGELVHVGTVLCLECISDYGIVLRLDKDVDFLEKEEVEEAYAYIERKNYEDRIKKGSKK